MDNIVMLKLINSALMKLNLLDVFPKNFDQILEPLKRFSFRQFLEQKIEALEEFRQQIIDFEFLSIDGYYKLSSSSSMRSEEELFSREKYYSYVELVRYLRRQLGNLTRLYDLHHLQMLDDFSIEISRNIFVSRWEKARKEQLIQMKTLENQELENQTNQSLAEIQTALDSRQVIDKFTAYEFKRIEDLIEHWMEKFEREKTLVESGLQRARSKKRHWEDMIQEYERRTEEIERLETLEAEYIDHFEKTASAKIIQAWWRANLKRRGIVLQPKRRKRAAKKGKKKSLNKK
ncbi:uncharacterized protein LOC129753321 [Uranotaenia lowii]|uniref:uncharacterized protein LOC129753321 n=1 Tax=Uranotaenia lowii TaxID=190385 RepID=UPI002478829C|nr:uncharacterized protein LOC129753321 [Uranotaenia lowii]